MVAFFNGENVQAKVGQTVEITSVDAAGWPRTALLSVGEVLVHSPSRLSFLTHANSRTTAALQTSRRAQLLTVLEGDVYKVTLEIHPSTVVKPPGFTVLGAHVVECTADQAFYAVVRHGIEFELPEPQAVLARWTEQIAVLRMATT